MDLSTKGTSAIDAEFNEKYINLKTQKEEARQREAQQRRSFALNATLKDLHRQREIADLFCLISVAGLFIAFIYSIVSESKKSDSLLNMFTSSTRMQICILGIVLVKGCGGLLDKKFSSMETAVRLEHSKEPPSQTIS